MKAVRPIKFDMGIMDSLLLISGLKYLEKDEERNPIDREGARRLRERILKEMGDNAVDTSEIYCGED